MYSPIMSVNGGFVTAKLEQDYAGLLIDQDFGHPAYVNESWIMVIRELKARASYGILQIIITAVGFYFAGIKQQAQGFDTFFFGAEF